MLGYNAFGLWLLHQIPVNWCNQSSKMHYQDLLILNANKPENIVVAAISGIRSHYIVNTGIQSQIISGYFINGLGNPLQSLTATYLFSLHTLANSFSFSQSTASALLPMLIIFEVGECTVVPLKLQNRVLTQFHFGHQGISHTKALAHSYIYWLNMETKVGRIYALLFQMSANFKVPFGNINCVHVLS